MRTRRNVTLSACCLSYQLTVTPQHEKNVGLRDQHAVCPSFRGLNQFTDFYKIWYAYYANTSQKGDQRLVLAPRVIIDADR